MKARLAFISAMIVIFNFTSICIADDFNFRKTKWGMSVSEVKASEPLEVVKEEGGILGYKTTVIGKNIFVAYYFTDNKLTRSRYILASSHTNKNDFISDYNDFKEVLTKKYGKPNKDETLWRNDLYKKDYSDWGTAISLGHLLYLSSWKTDDTEIDNMLMGENYDISCIIEYSSVNLKEVEVKHNEKKALDSF